MKETDYWSMEQMRRIAIVADIHGNLPALDAVLADIDEQAVDQVFNLGDCVSGPLWPRETCTLLMQNRLAYGEW
jgi:Calcineurin-like phosphoesterase superfamily domain